MFKKISAVVVSLVLILTCFCVNVSADIGDYKFYEVEPNNTFALADKIYNDYTVYGTISSQYDMDTYCFTLSTRSDVYLLSVADTAAVMIGIFDTSEECIYATPAFYSDGSYFIELDTTLNAGTYYFVVLYNNSDYYFYSSKTYVFYFTKTALSTHTHSYDNACDTTCNTCGQVRSVTHTYSNACDSTCNICNATRSTSHTYSNACDTTCNVCGTTRVTSHNYEWIIDVEATCETAGTRHEQCSKCGLTRNNNSTITAKGHDWDNGYVSKEATCGSDGEMTYSCENCLEMKKETIPRTNNHDYEWIVDIEETCEIPGSKHEECQECGATRNENTVINAKGHAWDNGYVSKEPTCAETGIRTYTCEVCFKLKVESIARTNNHIYTNDCDEECNLCGSKTRPKHNLGDDDICDDCGYIQEFIIGDVNDDGVLNVSDLAQLKKYIAGLLNDSETAEANPDVDGNGVINVGDLAQLKKIIAGLI